MPVPLGAGTKAASASAQARRPASRTLLETDRCIAPSFMTHPPSRSRLHDRGLALLAWPLHLQGVRRPPQWRSAPPGGARAPAVTPSGGLTLSMVGDGGFEPPTLRV